MHVVSRSSANRCSRLEPTLGHFSCNMEHIYSLVRRAGQYLPGVRNSNSSKAVQTVAAATTYSRQPQAQQDTVRLAVVGDVHGQWGPADAAAVRALEADAVLWVGDIGNEDVGMVQEIASLYDLDKAVILGNHDAWYTMTARGRQRASHKHGSSPPRGSSLSSAQQQQHQEQQQEQEQQVIIDRVQQQLDALGSDHVGYGHKALPGANISIVGARPFSKGGKDFSSMADFLARFGVSSMQQSADKILEVINTQVPPGNALTIMAHNGPTGMGGERHSICGCDWLAEAGDHGDPDLQQVLLELQQQAGRQVALLLHGHMHHMIKGGGRRQMVHIDPACGTVVLNAATVPRVVSLPHSNGSAAASRHHFLVVELQAGVPTCAADVWVQTAQQSDNTSTSTSSSTSSSSSSSSSSSDPAILEKQKSFLASSASAMHGIQHNKSKTKTAKQAAAKAAQDEAVRRVQLQAPQQVDLSAQQDPRVIDGYQVHVAEVYEVLRTVQPAGGTDGSTADAMAGAQAGGDGSGSSGVGSLGVRSWQYFDAHQGKWVSVVVDGVAAGVDAGVAVPASAPIGSIC